MGAEVAPGTDLDGLSVLAIAASLTMPSGPNRTRSDSNLHPGRSVVPFRSIPPRRYARRRRSIETSGEAATVFTRRFQGRFAHTCLTLAARPLAPSTPATIRSLGVAPRRPTHAAGVGMVEERLDRRVRIGEHSARASCSMTESVGFHSAPARELRRSRRRHGDAAGAPAYRPRGRRCERHWSRRACSRDRPVSYRHAPHDRRPARPRDRCPGGWAGRRDRRHPPRPQEGGGAHGSRSWLAADDKRPLVGDRAERPDFFLEAPSVHTHPLGVAPPAEGFGGVPKDGALRRIDLGAGCEPAPPLAGGPVDEVRSPAPAVA